MPIPSFLKQAATPGSTGFLIACLVVWLALRYLWPRHRRIDRSWLATFGGVYLVMSLPCVANAIADGLPGHRSPDQPSLGTVNTLVVLDGDNRVGRVRQAARVYGVAHPGAVHVLGGPWVVEALVEAGIPPRLIVQDSRPSTTREQLAWVERRFAARGNDDMGLIASRLQMPRVAALAKAAGLSLVLIPSPVDDEPARNGLRLFLPTYIALRVSRDALYEHAALAYYSWRGWIAPA